MFFGPFELLKLILFDSSSAIFRLWKRSEVRRRGSEPSRCIRSSIARSSGL